MLKISIDSISIEISRMNLANKKKTEYWTIFLGSRYLKKRSLSEFDASELLAICTQVLNMFFFRIVSRKHLNINYIKKYKTDHSIYKYHGTDIQNILHKIHNPHF